jgi:hypothetical protein
MTPRLRGWRQPIARPMRARAPTNEQAAICGDSGSALERHSPRGRIRLTAMEISLI